MAPIEPPRQCVAHYRLLERLGQGGMGVVYKAVDERLGRSVAVKLLSPRLAGNDVARRRFWQEARAIARLDHPNVCALFEAGEAGDGRLFLAMAFCEGETLARLLARGPLPVRTAVELARQVASGLDAAHRAGIVHRDVKPGNLIVAPDGRVKIVDFGLARQQEWTLLTAAGNVVGTAAYMAPEQVAGEALDARVDLWALGVVAFEMLAGRRPFPGEGAALAVAILQAPMPSLRALRPEVPAGLEAWVARALAKSPGSRHPDAATMGRDLALLAETMASTAAEPAGQPGTQEGITTWVEAPPSRRPPTPAEPLLDELSVGSLVGSYRIAGLVGAGGMGVVYRAEDSRLHRTVALKFLAPEHTRDAAAREAFLREARAVAALDHPNVCTIHEVGETPEGRLFLTMPCYDGETLAARLARGPLPAAEAVALAVQIARGLAKAHRRGLVHRDVKPANLIVTEEGGLKILDFGIARLAGEDGGGGTPAYMAPEQVRGEPAGPAGDVWALGVVLYEMLAGARPFAREGRSAVYHAILEDAPAPLARVPAALSRLVLRLLAKDRAVRPPTAVEVLAALEPLAVPAAVRWARRAAVLGLGLLLALLVGVLALGRGAGPSGPVVASSTRLTDLPGREILPDFAPDGRSFVYTRNVAGRNHLFRQDLAGGPPIDLSPRWDDSHGVFSPDGRQLALRSERDGGGLFVMNSMGGEGRRLTREGYDPAWSPDGRSIVFATAATVDPSRHPARSLLWIVDLASGASRLVVDADGAQPSFSPRGLRLAYWSVSVSGQRALWTIPVAGGPPRKVLEDAHTNWNPVWSPQGDCLYFASDRSGSMGLWRLPIDERSGAARGAPEPLTTPAEWAGMLAVSRDGRRLLFATDDSRSNIERWAVDGGRPPSVIGPALQVTAGSRQVRSLDVSPDGRAIVFETAWPPGLSIVPALGGAIAQLTRDAARDRGPRWAPDGSRIAFFSNRKGVYSLWTIRPDGSGLALVGTGDVPVFAPIWSLDGRQIFYSQGDARGQLSEWVTGLAGGARPAAFWREDFFPRAWSRDGRWVAGVSDRGVEVLDARTGSRTFVAPEAISPAWLGEDDLLYLAHDAVFAVERDSWTSHLLLPAVNGSEVFKLSGDPTGKALYLARSAAEGDVWLLNIR